MKYNRHIRNLAALLTFLLLLTGCGSPADPVGQTAPMEAEQNVLGLSLIHI